MDLSIGFIHYTIYSAFWQKSGTRIQHPTLAIDLRDLLSACPHRQFNTYTTRPFTGPSTKRRFIPKVLNQD